MPARPGYARARERVDDLTPRDVRLTLADGSTVTVAGREPDDRWSALAQVALESWTHRARIHVA